MRLTMFQIDAFAEKLFTGNPAAVCVTDEALPVELMQQMAMENNLSETAFVIPDKESFHIRWFTPRAEVELCGHATLASAYVLFNEFDYAEDTIRFSTRFKGELNVTKNKDLLTLDFPADEIVEVDVDLDLEKAFSANFIKQYHGSTDVMLIAENHEMIVDLQPDFRCLASLKQRGFIVSAPGNDVDFVSRFFCPALGIDEDPVTGSAHTTLTPYWSQQLGKQEMTARQLSERGGFLSVRMNNDRVLISGKAIKYLEGIVKL